MPSEKSDGSVVKKELLVVPVGLFSLFFRVIFLQDTKIGINFAGWRGSYHIFDEEMRQHDVTKQAITTALETERLELEWIGHMIFPMKDMMKSDLLNTSEIQYFN